jgi:hypothetical protein
VSEAANYTLGPPWQGQVCRSCSRFVWVETDDQAVLRRVFPRCPHCGAEYQWPEPGQDNGVYVVESIGSADAGWTIRVED